MLVGTYWFVFILPTLYNVSVFPLDLEAQKEKFHLGNLNFPCFSKKVENLKSSENMKTREL